MRSLLALVLLINLLGYLMMSNVPASSSIDNSTLPYKEYQSRPVAESKSLILLTELSDEGLASLVANADTDGAEDTPKELCDVLGPFADRQVAVAARSALLPDSAGSEGLILEYSSAEFWLSIPTSEIPFVPLKSWRQFETKKRYLEDCMEVASGLKFH